ncbi:hypothetical protein [Bacillus sp. NPDC093026]|uniref:hypothetical protein n=1 Tax=Bacillus sp. NPDC093026 TaxID=3363948 RepID=UPI00382159D3
MGKILSVEVLPTLPHTLYTLAKLLFRQNKQEHALSILEAGKLAAKKREDQALLSYVSISGCFIC